MDFNTLDHKVTLKCYKEKRGVRTFIYGLYNFFDDVESCTEYCNSLKKFLATSMKIDSEKGENNEEDTTGGTTGGTIGETINMNNAKRKKRNKKNSTPKIINDPVYSFRGDQIEKIREHLVKNKKVSESDITE
jgi:hypothetical protein